MNECGFKLPSIEFKLNNRLSRTLGRCCKLSNYEFRIELSKKYVQGCIETGNIRRLEQTILHELAHTLPNGYDHGKTWKSYVNIINAKFGYEITRLTSVPNELGNIGLKMGLWYVVIVVVKNI